MNHFEDYRCYSGIKSGNVSRFISAPKLLCPNVTKFLSRSSEVVKQ